MATALPADRPVDPPSNARRIAGATGIMMAAILGSRLLGLIRDAVISGKFGQGQDSDVYYAAFVLPDLLFYLIAGGALSSAFIPVFTEHITHGREKEAWHVFSTVACVMLLAVGVFVGLCEIFTGPLVWLTTRFQDPKMLHDTIPLTRIVLPTQLCFFLGGLMMGAQQSRGKFLIPALGPIVYNLGIIFGGVVLARWLGVRGLCWGALGGAVAGNFVLQLWALKREGMRFKPSLDWRHPDVMKVWVLMLPVILGLALPQVSILFNRMFAAGLGKGPLSAISRANMLLQVPLGVFAQAMGVAIFPTLSALAAQKKYAELRSTASMGIRSLLYVTIPCSVFMIVLAVPIIQLILQHGKFTAEHTQMTASALAFYCVGIFAWSAQSILARGFYALQDSRTPVIIGTAVTAVFIPLNLLFMNTFGLGYRGLALATTVAAILHMVAMLFVLRRRLNGIDGRKMAISTGKMLVASLAAGVVCLAARNLLQAVNLPGMAGFKLHAFGTLVFAFLAGIVVYAVASVLLRIEELTQVRELIRRTKT